jgi:hypothetical protein
VSLGRLFAAIAGLEFLWLLIRSLVTLVRLHTDYAAWPLTVFFAVLFPLTFGWAGYVLWRPKLPETRREAVLRSGSVWLVGLCNLILVLGLLDRPDLVLRSPF